MSIREAATGIFNSIFGFWEPFFFLESLPHFLSSSFFFSFLLFGSFLLFLLSFHFFFPAPLPHGFFFALPHSTLPFLSPFFLFLVPLLHLSFLFFFLFTFCLLLHFSLKHGLKHGNVCGCVPHYIFYFLFF